MKSVMPSNHLILYCPLLLLTSIFPSFRDFSNESVLHIRWPKYWSFSFRSLLPVNFQDWFPLGLTGLISLQSKKLKSLLQHHSSKVSILWCSIFLIVQLWYPYMTTRKITALNRCTFVSKVIALLFNMLSSLVTAFLTRSKCFNFMVEITICSDYGAQENKVCHSFHCFSIYLQWSDGTRWS